MTLGLSSMTARGLAWLLGGLIAAVALGGCRGQGRDQDRRRPAPTPTPMPADAVAMGQPGQRSAPRAALAPSPKRAHPRPPPLPCWPFGGLFRRRVAVAKLHRGERVPAAAMSRIRRTLPQGWSLQIKGNACHVTRQVPVHLYSLSGQDKAPVLGRTTFTHRMRFTLWFQPRLSLEKHRTLAQEMARRHKRLRGWRHQVARSGMSGLCFRNDAPPSRLKAYKRLADSMELIPTLYDETHSVHLLASTDGRSWELFDRSEQQEVTMVRDRLNALFQRYPKVANAPTR